MNNRIIIIEDHPQIREGFKEILEAVNHYSVINVYCNCEEAIANLEHDLPDVVLMDIGLPKMNGIDGTRIIRKKIPECIILIITVFEDSNNVFKSLCAGASGYIIKNANFNSIINSIEEALAGGAPMSLGISKMVIQSFQSKQDSPLTDREAEILQYISEGKSYSKIAEELFISKETVKSHTKNIYRKLQVVSKEDAIRVANKNKWVQLGYGSERTKKSD